MTREDYEELKRLRELGVDSVEMQPERYAVGIGKDNSVHWSSRGTLWFLKAHEAINIPTAIAAYEREHKEDVECWPDWKKRAALCNYEFGKEDA